MLRTRKTNLMASGVVLEAKKDQMVLSEQEREAIREKLHSIDANIDMGQTAFAKLTLAQLIERFNR